MELFYSNDIELYPGDGGGTHPLGRVVLGPEESTHCVKVLRHREGDELHVIDGKGTLYHCLIETIFPHRVEARAMSAEHDWGGHKYNLTMAVCPTKNFDRYEWFVEKATEIGVDRIVPVVGDHSERRIFRSDRLERLVLSAAKQSLKSRLPELAEIQSVRYFVDNCPSPALKLIAHCSEGCERTSIQDILAGSTCTDVFVLIGPEGDFSKEEIEYALSHGFKAVHLGPSRLRTETAGVLACAAVYLNFEC